MKVPVSEGLLYRTASAIARFGPKQPIEQLFQVGTNPPHLSYFSRGSARAVLQRAGLTVVDSLRDRDFEPEVLATRARFLSSVPGFVAGFAGNVAATTISTFGLEDSIVLFAK